MYGIWFVLTDDRADVLGSSKLVFVIATFLICGLITVLSLVAVCNAVTPLVKLSDDYPAVKVVFELITTITSLAVTKWLTTALLRPFLIIILADYPAEMGKTSGR